MTNLIDRILDRAIEIQQIPAPTFHEMKRAEFVRTEFVQEGLRNVEIDELGNVYGLMSSRNYSIQENKPLVISAHLDTVFPIEMDHSIKNDVDKIHGIGIGDNSLGVAALFGLIWMIKEQNLDLSGDVWFVANTGEEGLGDLRGMKGVVNRFGSDVLAYLILEGMALGHVYNKAVGVKRYRITTKTRGGHSWSDYGEPSAVLELSRLVVELSSIKLPSNPRTTLNVGRIQGGTSINTIPAEAWLELDMRSEGQIGLLDLIRQVDELIQLANSSEVRLEVEVIGSRPAGVIPADHMLINLAQDCLRAQNIEPVLTTGSTDANIPLSLGYPALVLGVSTGGGAHTSGEFINKMQLARGMAQLLSFVEKVWI